MGRFGGALDLAIQKDQADRELNVNAALRRREMRNRQKMAEAELAQRQSEFEHKRVMEGDENRRRNLISQREQDFWERTRAGEIEAKNAANRNAIRKGELDNLKSEQDMRIADSDESRKQAEADRKQKDWEETRGFGIDKLRTENLQAQEDLKKSQYENSEAYRDLNQQKTQNENALKELEIEEKKLAMKQANDLYNQTQEAFKKQQQEAEAIKTAQRTNIVAWFTNGVGRWTQKGQNLYASSQDASVLGKMIGIPGLDEAFVINQDELGRSIPPTFMISGVDPTTKERFTEAISPLKMEAMLSSIPVEGNSPLANGVSMMRSFFGIKQPDTKTEQARMEATSDYYKSITGHDAKNLQSALGGTGNTASIDAARSAYETSKNAWGNALGIGTPKPNEGHTGDDGGGNAVKDIDLFNPVDPLGARTRSIRTSN